jgi:hypothetical protein
MTALVWDQVGERRYETGIDRGVIYLPDDNVVAWNGLTSITENKEREVSSYYIDGIKYLDHHVPGSFSARLQAFTYPDELDELLGTPAFAPGVFIHDQRVSMFNLSYRTLIGNDLDSIDHGYKLHILYNITATPGSASFDSIGATLDPKPFEWTLSGTPATMFGIRPTSHISLDSRTIDSVLLVELEELIYGKAPEEIPDPENPGEWITVSNDPILPGIVDLLALVEAS